MPVTIGQQLGSYEITALLGKGGMGEVYRARDSKLKREVAIKLLPDEFSRDAGRVSRFQREAEVLASLNHPNIAAIYDLEEANETRFLVMELVEGETLADRIARGPIPVEEALDIGKHICEALEAAHEKGVVHRDLKPANVKITPEGRLKVLDFGLAKALDVTPASSTLSNSPTLTVDATRAGVILGTAAYMSPEQAGGKLTDARSDIWSFGAVLFELLAGKQAFPGESIADTLASVLKLEPDWHALPASTPASIQTLLRRCLTKNRKQRLQAIGEGRIAIEQQISNPEGQTAELLQPFAARYSKFAWISAASAIAAALIVSFFYFREPRQQPQPPALRYVLPLPESGYVSEFDVSPDGRYVVIAAEVNQKRQLWLQALDALEPQPIPSTDDGTYPFWSPDSQYIAFFANGRLKRIPLSGGQAQTLCNVTEGRGGAWNADHVILFASGAAGDSAVQRVPDGGGVPSVIVKKEGAVLSPRFLPDGAQFLYSVRGSSNETGVYVGSLDGGESRLLLQAAVTAVFAPASAGSRLGYLLYVRESMLLGRPFDSKTTNFAGDEFPVAENVTLGPRGPYTPIVTSDNGVLMYWNSSRADSVIAQFDRAARRLDSVAGLGQGSFPSISPNQQTIAFIRVIGTAGNVWLWDLMRGTDTRLTSDNSRNVDPRWSPKGDHIAFRSERGNAAGDLYVRSANGSGQDELLVKTANNKILSQWSPHGPFIVYTEFDPKSGWDLWVLPVTDDGKPRGKPMPFLQTNDAEIQGQVSPDGQWMAYVSNASGQREVYISPFPNADGRMKVSSGGGVQPRWRGDGKELFYVTLDGKMMAVPIKAGAAPKSALESGPATQLFQARVDTAGIAIRYDVTSDGTKFFVETLGASSQGRLTVWANWLAGLNRH